MVDQVRDRPPDLAVSNLTGRRLARLMTNLEMERSHARNVDRPCLIFAVEL